MYIVNLVGSECIGIRAATPTVKAGGDSQQMLTQRDIILPTIFCDHHSKHEHPTIADHQVCVGQGYERESNWCIELLGDTM